MRRLRDEQDGAVLVFVALILVVIIGFGAIAVDAGALYQEHRELQNGADAAALAIAQSCSEGDDIAACAGGTGDVDILAEYYADPNAEDEISEAVVDLSLWADNTIIVNTSTEQTGQAAGNIGTFFGRVLGIDTAATTASARAKWGTPVFGSLGTLPLVISACEYNNYVGGPGGGDGQPAWTTTINGPYDWLTFHDGNSTGDCAAVAGQDTDGDGKLSGGFGWIDTNGSCEATLTQIADGPDDGTEADYEASADTGASPSQTDCPPSYIEDELLGKVVAIPVFTDLYANGTNGVYVISYYAAYYIHGYHFGGSYSKEWDPVTNQVVPGKFSCPGGGDERCIAGWFTTMNAGSAEIGDGADTGVRVYGLD